MIPRKINVSLSIIARQWCIEFEGAYYLPHPRLHEDKSYRVAMSEGIFLQIYLIGGSDVHKYVD